MVVLNNNPDSNIVQSSKQDFPPEIQKVLQEFSSVFQEPKSLPPERSVDYAISLMDTNKRIN